MEITDIRIRRTFEDQPLKAILSVTFDDCLVLHDVKIVYAHGKSFVVMPSRKTPVGAYHDIVHPTKAAFREKLESALIAKYESTLEETPPAPSSWETAPL